MVINFNLTIYYFYGSSSVRLAYLNISGNLPQTFRRKSRDSDRTEVDVCLFDLSYGTKFLREFNFRNGRFFCVCFAGTNFCDWEKLVFLAGNYFLRFSGTRLLFGITAFSILEFKQSNTGEQHFFYYFI